MLPARAEDRTGSPRRVGPDLTASMSSSSVPAPDENPRAGAAEAGSGW